MFWGKVSSHEYNKCALCVTSSQTDQYVFENDGLWLRRWSRISDLGVSVYI